MELYLTRKNKQADRSGGELYVEFVFYCFTLEDTEREVPGRPVDEWKIDGKTAIPRGRYRVSLENSPKFGPNTMTINDVPGFNYIRIHGGNTEADTEGCVLVGYEESQDGKIVPGQSRVAVLNLNRVVREAILVRNDKVYITIL